MSINPSPRSNPDLELDELDLTLPASLVQNISAEVGEDLLQLSSWQNLQVAIAKTSGFKQWLEQLESSQMTTAETVAQYLRETLENLAY